MTRTISVPVGRGPIPTNPAVFRDEWGVATDRAGIEMYVWVLSDASIDAFIDARGYAADSDLPLKRRKAKTAVSR